MHIVNSKSKPEIPQELLDKLRSSAIAHKENKGQGESRAVFTVWMEEVAKYYDLSIYRGDEYNQLINLLDVDYPDWRGYRCQCRNNLSTNIERRNRQELILAAIAQGKTTAGQIRQETEIPKTTCYSILDTLQSQGLIERFFNHETGRPEFRFVSQKEAIAS